MHSSWRIAFYYVVILTVTSVLYLQQTKQAMLPRSQTPYLWAAEAAVIVGVLILRSGWGRDSGWRDEQARFGTIVNNFYEPRREALVNGFAVGGGVFLGLGWALATWGVVLGGMSRHVAGRGLLDFEIAALVGALTGGVVGAVIGLWVGHLWEQRHRRKREHRGERAADA
jgi:hypothetical protein